ncbi:MAG TPA: FIST N-terminal domain-containing protein [Puia sp.]|nr:FIST N-terminal domain-containing protein [Puia sp.]
MKTALFEYSGGKWAQHPLSKHPDKNKIQLVLCFSGKKRFAKEDIYRLLKEDFPNSAIAMCSTAGEIYNNTVQDNSVIAVGIEFEKTEIKAASVNILDFQNSYEAAKELAKQLLHEGLSYMMVISDGSMVNGSELVKGLGEVAGEKILVTGGLAGDGPDFSSTLIGLNEQPAEGNIIAIGFYGNHLAVTHGSCGGWDTFGLEKRITKSVGNILFEIDNKNALDLYKKYLGPDADQLPKSALLFPLSVTAPGSNSQVVRTILSIDEENKSMIFAGDVPEGSSVRFMRSNFDALTAAASIAAKHSIFNDQEKPGFALLVSCVGRKLILGPRIDEEVDAVAETFGNNTLLAGFYSYGEIAPFNEGGHCMLHNQTMTITSFYELP